MNHQPRTLTGVRELHQFRESHYGDGYHEPWQESLGCSCGAYYYRHMQHAGDCTDECEIPDIVQEHAEHVLAMAVRELEEQVARWAGPDDSYEYELLGDGEKIEGVVYVEPSGEEFWTWRDNRWFFYDSDGSMHGWLYNGCGPNIANGPFTKVKKSPREVVER